MNSAASSGRREGWISQAVVDERDELGVEVGGAGASEGEGSRRLRASSSYACSASIGGSPVSIS
jgi:hypothetical protein